MPTFDLDAMIVNKFLLDHGDCCDSPMKLELTPEIFEKLGGRLWRAKFDKFSKSAILGRLVYFEWLKMELERGKFTSVCLVDQN